MRKASFFLLFFSALFTSCKKEGDQQPAGPVIDLNPQWTVDLNGQYTSTPPNDSQWKSQQFNAAEMALFSSLDTISLSGTPVPDSMVAFPPVLSVPYPNPFVSANAIYLRFKQRFSAEVVFKAVVTDGYLKPLYKVAFRGYVDQSTLNAELRLDIDTGKYRLYLTLSAAGKPHFFKSSGNIQKKAP